MVSESAPKKKNANRFIIPAIIIVLSLILIFLSIGLVTSLNSSLYEQDQAALRSLTEQSSQLVSNEIMASADYAQVLKLATPYALTPQTDVMQYLKKASDQLHNKNIVLQFADSDGVYYSSSGDSGKISNAALNAPSAPDYQMFFSYGELGDLEHLFHLFRFEKPIEAMVNGTPVTLTHFALGISAKNLTDLYTAGLTDYSNGFILDKDGMMVYRDVSDLGLLMPGSNAFTKLENVHVLNGDKPAEVHSKLDNGETAICEVEITGGTKPGYYFFTVTPIQGTEWYAAAIIDSDRVNLGVENAMMGILVYIVVIILLLGGAAILVVIFIYRSKNERVNSIFHEESARKAKAESDAKSAFLSNMSHDIRTPMNAITGFTALARAHIDDKEKVSQCLEKIAFSSDHLLSLINDVLDMSRIESGKTEIINKPMNILTVSDNCLAIVAGQLQGRDLKLSHVYLVNHPQVLGDALHLRQIYINILGNAVKFTPDGGHITLRVIEVSSRIQDYSTFQIIFEDDGCGMSEEFQEKIWDAFSQEEEGSRTNYKGSGLGMAIVKNLVELMGGTITVESHINKGTKFTIEISLPQTDEETEEEPPLSQLDSKSLEGCKVLLVEDNEMNAEIATEILEEQGLIITHAENGKIAVELFSNSSPGTFDVILMDIMMPVMNGLEATKAIRALNHEDARTIPILAMTANAYTEDVERSLRAGMNAHLTKPVNYPALLKELQKFDKRRK